MKLYTVTEFKELIKAYPNGGVVFTEYDQPQDLLVTDGFFGATNVVPYDGQIFDWDFNIAEYVENNNPQFAVYDNADVLQMIQTLTRGLKIPLKAWFD